MGNLFERVANNYKKANRTESELQHERNLLSSVKTSDVYKGIMQMKKNKKDSTIQKAVKSDKEFGDQMQGPVAPGQTGSMASRSRNPMIRGERIKEVAEDAIGQVDPLQEMKEQMESMITSADPTLVKKGLNMMDGYYAKHQASFSGPSVADAKVYRSDYRSDTADSRSRIKAFKTMIDSTRPRDASLGFTGEDSPSGDKALVYLFAKMLDPTGIVTDKDFKNAQAGGSLDEQSKAWLQMIESGTLTDNIRQDIINTASNYYNGAIDDIGEKRSFYSKAAAEYKIPSSQLFDGNKNWDKYEQKGPRAGASATSNEAASVVGSAVQNLLPEINADSVIDNISSAFSTEEESDVGIEPKNPVNGDKWWGEVNGQKVIMRMHNGKKQYATD